MRLYRTQLSLLAAVAFCVGCSNGNSNDYRTLSATDVEQPAATLESPEKVSSENAKSSTALKSEESAAPKEGMAPEPAVVSSEGGKSSPEASTANAPASPSPVESAKTTESTADPKAASPNTAPETAPVAMAARSTSPDSPGDAPAEPAKPLEIKLLIPQKEFVKEGKEQALRVTFDDLDLLKVCNMEPVPSNVMEYLPDWLKDLNGQKIILRGWMFPSGRQEGISSFLFVRDNGICCFGRDPKVYDKLGTKMESGKTTKYIANRPFDVIATLIIEPDIEGPDEGLWWLYRLENARVIDQ